MIAQSHWSLHLVHQTVSWLTQSGQETIPLYVERSNNFVVLYWKPCRFQFPFKITVYTTQTINWLCKDSQPQLHEPCPQALPCASSLGCRGEPRNKLLLKVVLYVCTFFVWRILPLRKLSSCMHYILLQSYICLVFLFDRFRRIMNFVTISVLKRAAKSLCAAW